MNTGLTGCVKGNRLGSAIVAHSVEIKYTEAVTAKRLISVKASATKPVLMEVSLHIQTANNSGTAATISVGKTGAGYTDMLNAVDAKGAADVQYPAANAVVKRLLVADTDIYSVLTQTGTAATTGSAWAIFKLFELNTTQPGTYA